MSVIRPVARPHSRPRELTCLVEPLETRCLLSDVGNQISNGDMESWISGVPAGWTVASPGGTVQRDLNLSHDGASAVKFTSNGDATSYAQVLKKFDSTTGPILLQPNTQYEIVFWLKTTDVTVNAADANSKNNGGARLIVYKEDGTWLEKSAPITGTTGWQQYHFTFNSGNNAHILIGPTLWLTSGGSADFDGIQLFLSSPTSTNLIVNGDFQSTPDLTGWTPSQNGTFSVVTSAELYSRVLQIVDDTSAATVIGARQTAAITLDKYRDYVFSYDVNWTPAAAGSGLTPGKAQFYLGDGFNRWYSYQITQQGWHHEEKIINSVEFATLREFAFHIYNGAGTLQIDNVKLEPRSPHMQDLKLTRSDGSALTLPRYFDSYGNLLADANMDGTIGANETFVPIGFYDVEKTADFTTLANAGFNTVEIPVSKLGHSVYLLNYLNAAQNAGLHVIPYLPNASIINTYLTTAVINHPALLAWYIADEPNTLPMSREDLFNNYYLPVHRLDQKHPVLTSISTNVMAYYKDCVDILMSDVYPLPYPNPANLEVFNMAATNRRIAQAEPPGTKGVFTTNDAFQWPGYASTPNKVLTPNQIRSATYAALAGSARGILWFNWTWRDYTQTPTYYDTMNSAYFAGRNGTTVFNELVAEARDLSGKTLTNIPNALQAANLEHGSFTGGLTKLTYAIRRDTANENILYVIASNTSASTSAVLSLNLSAHASGKVISGITDMLTGAAITPSGVTTFSETIPAYAQDGSPARVYKVVLSAAPALAGVQVNDGAAQRSMVRDVTVAFDQAVNLAANAITLSLRGGATTFTVSCTNPSGDGRTYLLTFGGAGIVGGSLPDGIYDLAIKAAGVVNSYGQTLAGGDRTFTFHRLYGDYDGNATVNNGDYFQFTKVFGKTLNDGDFTDIFDYDNTGTINNGDYFQFKKRFGVSYVY